jgi:hypothetical protein
MITTPTKPIRGSVNLKRCVLSLIDMSREAAVDGKGENRAKTVRALARSAFKNGQCIGLWAAARVLVIESGAGISGADEICGAKPPRMEDEL